MQSLNIENIRPNWKVRLNDQERVWDLETGPKRFFDNDLAQIANQLIGVENLEEVEIYSNQFLKPYIRPEDDTNPKPPKIIMHSATDSISAYLNDFEQVSAQKDPFGFDTFFNQRSLALTRPGDISVGRGNLWKNALTTYPEVAGIDIQNQDYYQVSHALLDLATQDQAKLTALIDALSFRPDSVINMYVMDTEMQIFLNWLYNQVNQNRNKLQLPAIDHLNVEANSAEINKRWNQKDILHPNITEASKLKFEQNPELMLKTESRHSRLGKLLESEFEKIPGYTINPTDDINKFSEDFLLAARTMHQRYKTPFGVSKLANSTDGANITKNIQLDNPDMVKDIASQVFHKNHTFVLEAQVDFAKHQTDFGEIFELVPSSHILEGKSTNLVSLQFTKDKEWRGNISISDPNRSIIENLGITPQQHKFITEFMQNLSQKSVEKDLGLSIAGIDFAIGDVGGEFKNQIFVSPQDPNFRFFGAMFMYKFMEKVHELPGFENHEVATRLIHPKDGMDFAKMKKLAAEMSDDNIILDIISLVPPRFGMIAATGKTPREAAQQVLEFEKYIENMK